VLAWKVILATRGCELIPLLDASPVAGESALAAPLQPFAVSLVLGYIWLPFVALPIFVSLESLDRRLLGGELPGCSRLRRSGGDAAAVGPSVIGRSSSSSSRRSASS